MDSSKDRKVNLTRVYVLLHTSVFLYGLSGIFGRIITLEGTVLVWFRMLLTLGSLLFFPSILQKVKAIPVKSLLKLMGIGVLLALHWVAFFDSIRFSNVTIALSCLASSAFFTSLIEPLVFKRRIQSKEIFLGIMVIAGFGFMIEYTSEAYLKGVLFGIISALFYAFVAVGNKTMVDKVEGYVVTFVEFIGGVLFLSLILPFYFQTFPNTKWIPNTTDWVFLIALVLLCTTLAYNLTLIAMKDISAYTVALTLNLEPVYAIIMAYVIFREDKELHPGVYIAAVIILLSVFLDAWWKRRSKKSSLPESQQSI